MFHLYSRFQDHSAAQPAAELLSIYPVPNNVPGSVYPNVRQSVLVIDLFASKELVGRSMLPPLSGVYFLQSRAELRAVEGWKWSFPDQISSQEAYAGLKMGCTFGECSYVLPDSDW
jgi:hypothetical protein